MFEQIVFYAFSAILVMAATMVITIKNPIHAALALILAFFASSAVWLLMEAEFLAIVLVLVYVGAVMVLFLFVVMMLDINLAEISSGFARYLPVSLIVAFTMMVLMSIDVGPQYFGEALVSKPASAPAEYNNTLELGRVLYTDYVYPFELASVILLVAIIAAIALSFRGRKNSKAQKPELQVSIRREDRIRIVKMEAEKE